MGSVGVCVSVLEIFNGVRKDESSVTDRRGQDRTGRRVTI